MGYPSALDKAMILLEEPDRLQPRLDRDAGRVCTVSVGGVEKLIANFTIRTSQL